jgi:hypothetical protein
MVPDFFCRIFGGSDFCGRVHSIGETRKKSAGTPFLQARVRPSDGSPYRIESMPGLACPLREFWNRVASGSLDGRARIGDSLPNLAS